MAAVLQDELTLSAESLAELLGRLLDCRVLGSREVSALTPHGATTAQLALRWLIDQPGLTTVIPGARNAEQARLNAAAADLLPLADDVQEALRRIYDDKVRPHVHSSW